MKNSGRRSKINAIATKGTYFLFRMVDLFMIVINKSVGGMNMKFPGRKKTASAENAKIQMSENLGVMNFHFCFFIWTLKRMITAKNWKIRAKFSV